MIHIQDFHRRFRNHEQCLAYLFALRFPEPICPKCGRKDSYHKHPTKHCYTCNCGRSHIFPCKGTIFENSALPLSKWFYAIFLMCTTEYGVPAKELERRLDVTYPTAWRMTKKIRAMLPIQAAWKEHITLETLFLPFVGKIHLPLHKQQESNVK